MNVFAPFKSGLLTETIALIAILHLHWRSSWDAYSESCRYEQRPAIAANVLPRKPFHETQTSGRPAPQV